MSQPKTPPLSIRPGEARLARIDAYAEKHKLSRHLAILVLLDAGLGRAEAVLAPRVAAAGHPISSIMRVSRSCRAARLDRAAH